MRCHKAERWLLRDQDGRLSNPAKMKLEAHVQICRDCARMRKNYGLILGALRAEPSSTQPDFWGRLQAKLNDRAKATPWAWMRAWSLRAVPLSLLVILTLVVTMLFFFPSRGRVLSQTEALLLRNEDPYLETKALFEETRLENKNLMLIFTADEKNPSRNFRP
jgi:hypothetical protein